MSYTANKIKIHKPMDGEKKWSVFADFRSLETFEDYDNNYEIVDKLKENRVLSLGTEEDSEYCMFAAYFSTLKSAENFVKRLSEYVEKRKKIISVL
jgi:hypothetical protein